MLIPCSRCLNDCEIEAKEESVRTGFVCAECRCADCQIVLCVECSACGEIHGKPSSDNPRVCEHCIEMRVEVAALDSESQAMRTAAIAGEDQLYL